MPSFGPLQLPEVATVDPSPTARDFLPTADDIGMELGYGLMERTLSQTGDVRFLASLDGLDQRAEDEGWAIRPLTDAPASSDDEPTVLATGAAAAAFLTDTEQAAQQLRSDQLHHGPESPVAASGGNAWDCIE